MRRHPGRAGALLVSLLATPVAAQQVMVADGLAVKLSGRIHVQFATTSVDSLEGAEVPGSAFILRRARLTFDVTVNDLVSARVEPDYSTSGGVGRMTLRDAYVRLTFGPGLRATLGQFKRPLDLFQLASTTQLLVAERGGLIRGVRACGSLPAVCSYSTLAVGLLYADRDLGLLLDGEAVPRRLRYAAAVTNGEPFFAQETSSGKQITARFSAVPLTGITVSANGAYKDYAHPTTAAAERAIAWGGRRRGRRLRRRLPPPGRRHRGGQLADGADRAGGYDRRRPIPRRAGDRGLSAAAPRSVGLWTGARSPRQLGGSQ
jgi:hypothetical protein